MVSNQQNLNQVGIDEFLHALKSLGVNKNDISGKPLKIKYCNVTPYSIHKRQYTPTTYEDEEEDDDGEKKSASKVISIEFIKTTKHHPQVGHKEERAMFTSHPGASLKFFMFIN